MTALRSDTCIFGVHSALSPHNAAQRACARHSFCRLLRNTGITDILNYSSQTRKVKGVFQSFYFFVYLHILGLIRSELLVVLSKCDKYTQFVEKVFFLESALHSCPRNLPKGLTKVYYYNGNWSMDRNMDFSDRVQANQVFLIRAYLNFPHPVGSRRLLKPIFLKIDLRGAG